MACLSRPRAVLGLCMLPVLVHASWFPRPLTDFESGLPAEGSPPGFRRFRHHEVHQFDDGSDLELQWEVDADPESILSLDLEHARGARVRECARRRLVLHVPHEHAARAARWRHVTASDALHGCSHLRGDHLYHRIVRVEDVKNHSKLSGVTVIRLATRELTSPSQVFPHCRYFFNLVPAEAKDPLERVEASMRRKLSTAFGNGGANIQNSFQPSGTSAKSLLNFDVPTQLSNLGYNWDYDANSTVDPQFKYTFPGGVGWARLYQPYLRAHFSLNINFSSNIKSMSEPPHVTVTAELAGHGNFNLDLATAVNFKKEKSAGVLQDVLKLIKLPGFSNPSNGSDEGEAFLNPIKFYFGGTPLTIKPGFSCKLKAYHIGLLKGSLRVGLQSAIVMKGVMTFDSSVGLLTNVSARADNISFTAPTWMLFTQHFEMGMMLEPMFWIKGGFGDMKDMEIGFALRPYFNVSIMQEHPAQLGGDTSAVAGLAIYPFRAVGLPPGGNYAIRVSANGQNKTTAVKFSTGIVEFNDNVEDFDFGTISQTALLTVPIEVAIMEDGQASPVATGQAVCSTVVNGICKPSPVTAQLQLNGKTVSVHLTVVWSQNALSTLMSKIKSVALRFPTVSVSQAVSQQLSSPEALASAELRVTRSGRTYSVPLARKDNSSSLPLLKSRVIYDLGPCFLDSWKTDATDATGAASEAPGTAPRLELLVGGSVVGTGSMPPVSWDKTTTLSGASSLAGNIKSNLKTIPVMVPLYPPGGGSSVVATAEIEIDVLPAQLAAFWVYPYQAETFTVGAQHTLYWTLVNGKEGQAVNFTLTAMEVGQDGSLTPTSWQQPVRASCSVDSTVAVKRYAGGVPACLFAYNMLVPSSLADKQIVLVASWLGGAVLSPHWMVSTPVRFASGRRLNVGKWGTKSLGSVNHTGLRGKAKEKLQKLASHCSAQPLKYKLNAGMNFVEHMKNVILPVGGGMMGGFGERPDWTSKPKPVLNRFGPGHGAGDLSDILPKLLCSGGVCEGMMPGCNRTRVNPLEISKINVQLSRLFRWKKHFGPKMRHMIAYGLALAPSAIQIGQNSAGARRLRMVSAEDPTQHDGTLTNNIEPQHIPRKLKAEHPFATDDGHFAVERDNGEDDEFGDAEFDSFSVQITEPIDYDLTQELLDKFLRRGAFRGISDGREQSHGPVEIVGFKLVKLPRTGPAAPQLLYGVPRPSGEWPEHRSSPGLHSWKYQVTATSVACMALLGALFVMARAAIRRRGYTLVDPPNVLGDARWFA